MICYKDKTFCCVSDCVTDCSRRLTQDGKYRAEKLNLPVAFSDFRDTDHCAGYTKAENK